MIISLDFDIGVLVMVIKINWYVGVLDFLDWIDEGVFDDVGNQLICIVIGLVGDLLVIMINLVIGIGGIGGFGWLSW